MLVHRVGHIEGKGVDGAQLARAVRFEKQTADEPQTIVFERVTSDVELREALVELDGLGNHGTSDEVTVDVERREITVLLTEHFDDEWADGIGGELVGTQAERVQHRAAAREQRLEEAHAAAVA